MVHNGPPHSSNFGYAYSKRMIDVQNRFVENLLILLQVFLYSTVSHGRVLQWLEQQVIRGKCVWVQLQGYAARELEQSYTNCVQTLSQGTCTFW